MSTSPPNLGKLTGILCDKANYTITNSLQNGVAAVIKALIDEAPSKAELEKIYYEYGLEGVRDYILGSDNLLPNPPVSVGAAFWELAKKYKELRTKHEDLQKQYEALADTNSKDLEELRRLHGEHRTSLRASEHLDAVCVEACKLNTSVTIIGRCLEEIYKDIKKDTNKPSS